MMLPLAILVTGDALESTQRSRGQFADLIQQNIARAWAGEYVVLDARSDTALPRPGELAGILVTGSAASVTERAPWMLRAEAYLRTAVSEKLPVLGICFGHQLLGQALGGEVQRNPHGREIGSVVLRCLEDDVCLGAPGEFCVNSTHIDSIVRLPAGAQILATTALEPCAAVKFAELCYGVQFHPEFDAEVMHHYLDARQELMLAEGLNVPEIRANVANTPISAQIFARFIEQIIRLQLLRAEMK